MLPRMDTVAKQPAKAPWILLGAVALASTVGLVAWNAGYLRLPIGAPDPETLATGYPAPDFERKDLSGKAVSLSDFEGRPVVVDFWATWCGPCHIQARVLEPLVAEYRDRVTFLAVSLGEEAETVERFFGATPPPYPVLLDPTDALSARFGIHALPTMMVVGKDGKIVYFEAGIADEPTLRQALAAAGAA
jgi:thiol-disulfide isomerase/thioredoxin